MQLQFLLPCRALFRLVGDDVVSARLAWSVVHIVQGQQSMHFCWEINLILTSGDKERATCSKLQFEDATAEKLLQTDVVPLLSQKMEGQTTCIVQIRFLQTLFAFLFLMEPGYREIAMLCPGQGVVPYFWILLKSWWVFLSSGAPSALEQVEPLGLIFLTVSVLGLHMPNITCLCCHQGLQEKLFSCWRGNAWTGTFYIPVAHSTRPLWKFAWWEKRVLVAHKDSLHSAGTFQGQLFGDHWPAPLAGDGLVVRLDIVLAEERQCMGWVLPDAEWECNTLGRWSYFFASRRTVNSCF